MAYSACSSPERTWPRANTRPALPTLAPELGYAGRHECSTTAPRRIHPVSHGASGRSGLGTGRVVRLRLRISVTNSPNAEADRALYSMPPRDDALSERTGRVCTASVWSMAPCHAILGGRVALRPVYPHKEPVRNMAVTGTLATVPIRDSPRFTTYRLTEHYLSGHDPMAAWLASCSPSCSWNGPELASTRDRESRLGGCHSRVRSGPSPGHSCLRRS